MADVLRADDFGDGLKSLLIPIRNSEESVEVRLDELPEDPSDILDILKAEVAPLEVWLKFAVAYYKQGKVDSFKQILLEGADPGIEEFYGEFRKERIAILNTLAAYYTQQAAKTKEKSKREDWLSQATQNYNRADKIDILEEMTWVGKGVLLLTRGDVNRAGDFFDNVLRTNAKNIPALLGKACIFFNKGNYEEALKCYKEVLRSNPRCSPTVRLGLGLCYYKLEKMETAKIAFERVLQLEPRNVEALVGLSIIEINKEGPKAIPNAMALIKRAFELNSSNSMVLNYLADHYFYRGDYQKAQDLALQAYHNTEVDKIKAESCFHIARAYHAGGDYDRASQYYFQATQLWADFPLAQFRLGQMYIHKGETEKAVSCFESVLQSYPDNPEALKILGSLYVQSNRKEKAFTFLKKATDLNPDDVEPWIELAQLYEGDHKQALNAYTKARKILEKRKEPIPSEMYSNIGVLYHVLGQLKEAEECYTKAIEVSGYGLKEFALKNITITYNIARIKEDLHNFAEAEELYKGILQEHPNYVDCYLRLGQMAQTRGQIYEASVWIKDAFTSNPKLPEAWALLGNLHLQKDDLLNAQKKFEKILESDRHDVYALLSLGNIYYNAKFDKKDKEEKYLKYSFDFYWKVLQMDPSNIYAANGIGAVFAERGKLNEAKEFFIQVREATGDVPDVWVNLAHVYLAQGQHINAIKMYQNCSKKFYFNKDVNVLLYLAKAFFEAGKMEDCKQTLQKAIHLAPQRKEIWFDLALSQEQLATSILRKEKRTLAEIKKSIVELVQANNTFKSLLNADAKTHIASRAEKHAKYCENTIELAKKQRARAEEQERIWQEKREKMRADQEAELLKKAMEEEEKERRDLELRLKQEEVARETESVLESLRQSLVVSRRTRDLDEEDGDGGKKKKRKKKDKFIDDGEEADNASEPEQEGEGDYKPGDEDEEGEGFKDFMERGERGKALSELASKKRSEREDNKDDKKRRKKRDRGGDGEKESKKEKKKKKKEKKRKIKDFIIDSDEEKKQEENKTEEGEEGAASGTEKQEEGEGEIDIDAPTQAADDGETKESGDEGEKEESSSKKEDEDDLDKQLMELDA